MLKYGTWSLEKFGGQTTKNDKGIRKMDLKMLKCVLMGPNLF